VVQAVAAAAAGSSYSPYRRHMLHKSNGTATPQALQPTASNAPSSCFTPFCFNVPCQFRQILNLSSFVFGVTPTGLLLP